MISENVRLLFQQPKVLFRTLKPQSRFGFAILVILIASFLQFWLSVANWYLTGLFELVPFLSTMVAWGWIALPVASILGMFIFGGIQYGLLRLFGGGGEFVEFFYLVSVVFYPIGIAYSILLVLLGLLTLIPGVGIVIGLLSNLIALAYMIWTLYLLTLCLKEVGQCETWRAVLAWLVPFILIFVIVLVGIGIAVVNYFPVAG